MKKYKFPEKNIIEFRDLRIGHHRYASFDYCYNHFNSFVNKKPLANSKYLELSCLHLGFYLASWGMLRMSGYLGSSKSMKFFEKTILLLSESTNDKIWSIDVSDYMNNNNIDHLIEWYNKIEETLYDSNSDFSRVPTKTLLTKVMLGVFACTPALDNNFRNGMGIHGKFNFLTLTRIYDFYTEHKKVINKYSKKIKTIDFLTNKKTKLSYTKAKIVDMIGFMEGYK